MENPQVDAITARRRTPRRPRSRGVAALEFALSLTFLVPLLMGMLDFGYYFYIGTNAEEAARAAVRALVNAPAGVCGSVNANNAITAQTTYATGSGYGCTGGAAYCYMNEPPLSMGASGGPTTVTVTCLGNPPEPVDPTWKVDVRVSFVPALGFFKNLMPAGSTSTTVSYTAHASASN